MDIYFRCQFLVGLYIVRFPESHKRVIREPDEVAFNYIEGIN